MSKSNLISSLFKIDAAEGFVRYVNAVKPFHSKILDVLIEYVYKEDIKCSVTEKWKTDVHQFKTTTDVTWDASAGQYVPSTHSCYFDIIASTVGAGGSFTITGWHAEKFLTGQRFQATDLIGHAKTFIIASAENIPDDANTNTFITRVHIVPTQSISQTIFTTILLAFTPEYNVESAILGFDGAWVITGDFTDEFQIGEQVTLADVSPMPNMLDDAFHYGVPRYTINGQPRLSTYTPFYDKSLGGFDIIGVSPATPTYYGVWIVAGDVSADIQPGTSISIEADLNKPLYSVVTKVTVTTYDTLASYSTVRVRDYTDHLAGTPVTLLEVDWIDDVASSQQPHGKIFYNVTPSYVVTHVAGHQVTVQGQYANRFSALDTVVCAGVTYVIRASYNDPSTNQTVITIAGPAGIIVGETLAHPALPVTTIPVAEPVLDYANQRGEYYRTFKTGTLRHLPLIIKQIAEPSTDVIGAVWINPVTNVSQRWTASGWVHNYTKTNYAWSLDQVNPKTKLVIKSATAQDGTTNNSFLIDTTDVYQSRTFSTVSLASNQFMFSETFSIIRVDPVANKWVVDGIANVSAGEIIYITSSSSKQGVGKYTVRSVSTVLNTTEIYVTRQISRLASADGYFAVPSQPSTVPAWVEGTRVKVTSTASLPNPLLATTSYYFVPVIKPHIEGTVETPPIFALATKRKPQHHDDYVDVTTFGSGVLTLTQDEVFVPGTRIDVSSTYNSRNNGKYTIISTSNETATRTRIRVAERIRSTTPLNLINDGIMVFDRDSHVYSSLTERECRPNQTSELHASATITEYVEFVFTIDEFDYIASALAENQDNSIETDIGFDMDGEDMTGFDGTYVLLNSETARGVPGRQTFIHNMIPTGFDTQFFDMGGIDETIASVSKNYGHNVP